MWMPTPYAMRSKDNVTFLAISWLICYSRATLWRIEKAKRPLDGHRYLKMNRAVQPAQGHSDCQTVHSYNKQEKAVENLSKMSAGEFSLDFVSAVCDIWRCVWTSPFFQTLAMALDVWDAPLWTELLQEKRLLLTRYPINARS